MVDVKHIAAFWLAIVSVLCLPAVKSITLDVQETINPQVLKMMESMQASQNEMQASQNEMQASQNEKLESMQELLLDSLDKMKPEGHKDSRFTAKVQICCQQQGNKPKLSNECRKQGSAENPKVDMVCCTKKAHKNSEKKCTATTATTSSGAATATEPAAPAPGTDTDAAAATTESTDGSAATTEGTAPASAPVLASAPASVPASAPANATKEFAGVKELVKKTFEPSTTKAQLATIASVGSEMGTFGDRIDLKDSTEKPNRGIDFLGIGYDLLFGNPVGDPKSQMDPGFREPVVDLQLMQGGEFTRDLQSAVPRQGFSWPVSSCARSSTTTMETTSEEYMEDLQVDASVSGEYDGMFKAAFSASVGYKNFEKEIVDTKSEKYTLDSYCFDRYFGLYQNDLKPTDAFATDLARLPWVASPLCDDAIFDSPRIKCITIALEGKYLNVRREPSGDALTLEYLSVKAVTQAQVDATSKYLKAWTRVHAWEQSSNAGKRKAAGSAFLGSRFRFRTAEPAVAEPANQTTPAKPATPVMLVAPSSTSVEYRNYTKVEGTKAYKNLAEVEKQIAQEGLAGTAGLWWAWDSSKNTISSLIGRKQWDPPYAVLQPAYLQCTGAVGSDILDRVPSVCLIKSELGDKPEVAGMVKITGDPTRPTVLDTTATPATTATTATTATPTSTATPTTTATPEIPLQYDICMKKRKKTWTHCADEHQTCVCPSSSSSSAEIVYGRKFTNGNKNSPGPQITGAFLMGPPTWGGVKHITNVGRSTECSNAVFGDPCPSFNKQCFCGHQSTCQKELAADKKVKAAADAKVAAGAKAAAASELVTEVERKAAEDKIMAAKKAALDARAAAGRGPMLTADFKGKIQRGKDESENYLFQFNLVGEYIRLSWRNIFSHYGTHYIDTLYTGGRMQTEVVFDSSAKSSTKDEQLEIQAAVAASYGSVSGNSEFGMSKKKRKNEAISVVEWENITECIRRPST